MHDNFVMMVDIVKGGGRAQANFSIMMECTPESGRCHSVYSVITTIRDKRWHK